MVSCGLGQGLRDCMQQNIFINLRARAVQNQQPSCFLVFAGCLVIHGPDARYPANVLTAHV